MSKQSPTFRLLTICLLVITICVILYFGQAILLPLTYGGMFAFLVNPIYQKLRKFNANRYFSAIISVLTIVLFVFILFSAFGWQIQQLAEQSDKIKQELVEQQERVQGFVKNQFGISMSDQKDYAQKFVDKLETGISSLIGSTTSILGNAFLSLILAILFLTEQKRFKSFFFRLFDSNKKVVSTIEETSKVIQKYLTGKLGIITILGVAYSIGFLIMGIQYAILIAILVAFLSFIPYVGNMIGSLIAALITFATGGTLTDVLIIFAIIGLAQVIESYVLEPWIVGSNVDLNPLFSILAVIGMSLIWGAAGAVIALPFIGILKVLFSHIEAYKPLAFLMSDEEIEQQKS